MSFEDLTERELDILRLIEAHLSNAQIGDELSLSTKTVEWHVAHILAKLGATDRHEAARIYRARMQPG
jgi:DNA-binding NarL/FixJ family response regulator